MAQIFTNCKSCYFLSDEPRCKLDLWELDSYKNNLVISDDQSHIEILNKICPYHRTEGWAEKKSEPLEDIKKEVKLKYGLVVCLDQGQEAKCLETIDKVQKSDQPASSLYIIDFRESGEDHQSLLKSLEQYGVPYMGKLVIDSDAPKDKMVDELVMSKKLKEPFYVCSLTGDIDVDFLRGLHISLLQKMEEIMWAGNSEVYFVPTAIHQVVKNGFDLYIEQKVGPESCLSYSRALELAR